MKSKGLTKTVAILGLVFGILGLVLAFLPLGSISVLPGGIGLLLGVLAYFIAKNVEMKKTIIYIVLIISLVGILISGFKIVFVEEEVAVDTEFIEKNEQSLDDAKDVLDELEGEFEEEFEEEFED